MKYNVRKLKSMAIALKELEPFVKNGSHLSSGRPFKRLGGMRSREVLANWLICAVYNHVHGADALTFTSDPIGSDGILYETNTKETWPTEHVMVPEAKPGKPLDIEKLIFDKVTLKQSKGGTAYASGKTLIVFLEAGSGVWFPNRAAQKMPANDFSEIWVVGLQRIENDEYIYGVTNLVLRDGNVPAWSIKICSDFDEWQVKRIQ